jgi:hypothetical protein|tara:strand:- start:256 stop:360 length:105 start_codon:yes stop_codon:yes gene_type:complete
MIELLFAFVFVAVGGAILWESEKMIESQKKDKYK